MRLEILAFCPFSVATLVWQSRPGEWRLSVCVKASFELAHGRRAALAATQLAPSADVHWDDDPSASLRAPSDFVPYKPKADILVTGHASSPGGSLVNSLVCRVRVGDFVKALNVSGDRAWGHGQGGAREGVAAPFQKMPLRYERAALSPENPVGALGDPARAEVGKPMPNITLAGDKAGSPVLAPGLGPLHMMWRARRRGLDDAAILWAYRMRLTRGAPPSDFDFAFFNAAPMDQQVESIPPGVTIALEGLHPNHARLESQLPIYRAKLFRVRPGGVEPRAIEARCDTLWIDADRALAVVTWRGVELLEGPDEAAIGTIVVAAETEEESVGPEDVARLLRGLSRQVRYIDPAAVAAAEAPSSAPENGMLRAPPRAPVFGRPPALAPAPAPAPASPPTEPEGARVTLPAKPSKERRAPLPFVTEAAGAKLQEVARMTMPAKPSSAVGAPLPFRPTQPPLNNEGPPSGAPLSAPGAFFGPPPPPPPPPPSEPGRSSLPPLPPPPPPPSEPRRSSLPPLPPPASGPAIPATPTLILSRTAATISASASEPESPPALPASPAEVSPPPMLFPIMPERPSRSAPPPEEKAPEPPAAPELSIEACAAIAAELGERGATRAEILRAHKLTEQTFVAAERRWTQAMEGETARGAGALLNTYDAAYIKAIEKIRGSVTPAEYARVVVGGERGQTNEVLAALKIQRSAVMRLKRVFAKRMAVDAALKAEVNRALAELRK